MTSSRWSRCLMLAMFERLKKKVPKKEAKTFLLNALILPSVCFIILLLGFLEISSNVCMYLCFFPFFESQKHQDCLIEPL